MKNWVQLAAVLVVLAIAMILTLYQVFPADTLAYFSDITTPLILVVGFLLIVVGLRKEVL